jgi:hypothetical protein
MFPIFSLRLCVSAGEKRFHHEGHEEHEEEFLGSSMDRAKALLNQ